MTIPVTNRPARGSGKLRGRTTCRPPDFIGTAGIEDSAPPTFGAAAMPVDADRRQLNPTSTALASRFLLWLRAFVYASR
jgi:hypothetical protein